MDSGILFIGTAIAGLTQFIKLVVPQVSGAVTIAVSAAVGLLVALLDTQLGVTLLTPAQGITAGLGAAGVVGALKQVNTGGTSSSGRV